MHGEDENRSQNIQVKLESSWWGRSGDSGVKTRESEGGGGQSSFHEEKQIPKALRELINHGGAETGGELKPGGRLAKMGEANSATT